jgi:AcrR family transcriptional regulator
MKDGGAMTATDTGHPASEAKTDANRRRILDATERLIAVRGIEKVRLRDIAQEAKVSIGMIQHYFLNREIVIEEMLNATSLRRVAEWAEVAAEINDPREKLISLLDHAVTDRRRCVMWLATVSVASRNDQYLPDVARIYGAWREKLASVIESGSLEGTFIPTAPIDEVVDTIVCVIDGLMTGVGIDLVGYTPDRNSRLLRHVTGLLLSTTFDS